MQLHWLHIPQIFRQKEVPSAHLQRDCVECLPSEALGRWKALGGATVMRVLRTDRQVFCSTGVPVSTEAEWRYYESNDGRAFATRRQPLKAARRQPPHHRSTDTHRSEAPGLNEEPEPENPGYPGCADSREEPQPGLPLLRSREHCLSPLLLQNTTRGRTDAIRLRGASRWRSCAHAPPMPPRAPTRRARGSQL